MIKAMHYLAGALLILGFAYKIDTCVNVAAGLLLGFGTGSWIQYNFETAARQKEIAELSELIHRYLKSKTYDPNIPDSK